MVTTVYNLPREKPRHHEPFSHYRTVVQVHEPKTWQFVPRYRKYQEVLTCKVIALYGRVSYNPIGLYEVYMQNIAEENFIKEVVEYQLGVGYGIRTARKRLITGTNTT